MDHWGAAKAKLGAMHAIQGHRGGVQKHDPEYDAQAPLQEPEEPPPFAALHRNPQSQGLNASYYQTSAWSPSQPAANVPGHQYNSYATSQGFQSPAQGYSPMQQSQSPPPQHHYGIPQQQYSPSQGQGPYLPANADCYQNNQYSTYTGQRYESTPSASQYSAPQDTASPPPQAAFFSLQRSTTDYYTYPQVPSPVQRSQTVPVQHCSLHSNQDWDP